jgi:hypothetical protein
VESGIWNLWNRSKKLNMECGIWNGQNRGIYGMELEFQYIPGVYFAHGGRCLSINTSDGLELFLSRFERSLYVVNMELYFLNR